MSLPDLSGIVLAGGRSSRMGADKATALVDGVPMVVRAVSRLETVCSRVVVASGDGHRFDALGFEQVADVAVGAGPLAGIVAGLERVEDSLAAVVAVDMPDASPAILRLLAGAWAGEPAVVPWAHGRLQPLHAVYAREALGEFRRLLAAGCSSPTAALEELGALVIRPSRWRLADPDGRFARNVNTPRELDDLRATTADPGSRRHTAADT